MLRACLTALMASLAVVACDDDLGEGRVSSTVSFSTDRTIPGWLADPSEAAVEAYIRFPANLAENIWFGVNIEFVGGTENPTRFAQEDFAALVLVTRDGLVALPRGTDSSHIGTPDGNDVWEPRTLDRKLAPETWHRIRLEADFGDLTFSRLVVESPGATTELDLSGLPLSYPNPIPVDGRALTWYVHAIANAPAEGGSGTAVLFDDAKGEVRRGGAWQTVYHESFDTPFETLPDVPFTFPEMKLRNAVEGILYLENENARLRHRADAGRSGGALQADAAVASD